MIRLPYEGNIYVSSPYGYRTLNGSKVWHSGLDLVGQTEDIIRAPADGYIVTSTIVNDKNDRTWEWGNYVRLSAEGYQIYMCHMSHRLVEAGQRVKAGDPLGIQGSTGYSFGTHCHFEMRLNGAAVDPTPILGIKNKVGKVINHFPKEDNMTKEEFKKLLDECGPEIYKLLVEYLAQQSESTWSKSEGYFRKATKSGIMDGMNPRGFVTREQIAAILGRMGLIV